MRPAGPALTWQIFGEVVLAQLAHVLGAQPCAILHPHGRSALRGCELAHCIKRWKARFGIPSDLAGQSSFTSGGVAVTSRIQAHDLTLCDLPRSAGHVVMDHTNNAI